MQTKLNIHKLCQNNSHNNSLEPTKITLSTKTGKEYLVRLCKITILLLLPNEFGRKYYVQKIIN